MKLFKVYLSVLFVLTMWACNKKSVKLPVITSPGIQDTIYNNTQVWLFFKAEAHDTIAELNRNNTISTTHWIFNIDKRLKLKHVIPHIQYLQAKREKPSVHQSNERIHNYYSYVDNSSNTLSMLDFTDVKYITEPENQILNPNNIALSCTSNGVFINEHPTKFSTLKDDLLQVIDTLRIQINLHFDKNISYQDYLYVKAILYNIKNDSIVIQNNEFIPME